MSATFAAAIDASYRGADDAYPKLSERINRLEARDARHAGNSGEAT